MLAVFQLDPKHSVRQSLQHLCHDFYSFFLRHILSEWSFDAADKLRIITRGIPFAKSVHYRLILWLDHRGLQGRLAGNQGQHLGTLLGYGYRVLEVSAGLAVDRNHGPAVRQDFGEM